MATLHYNRVPAFVNPFYGFQDRPAASAFPAVRSSGPAVNVRDNQTAIQLELAVPGLQKDALKITLEDNTLTIAYQPPTPADDTTGQTFTRQEFGISAFERGFRLPKHISTSQITATYTDGILTIMLPKEVAQKVVKEITVA